MGWLDIIKEIFTSVEQAQGAMTAGKDVKAHELGPSVLVKDGVPEAGPTVSPPPTHALPDREGSFIVIDTYPGDLGGHPNWAALDKNANVGRYEVLGAFMKATEGVAYGYTNWFVQNVGAARQVYGGRLGEDRFLGAYHFLQLGESGAKQADFFVQTLERAGMPRRGDLRPMLDFEQGGQHNFFPAGVKDLSTLPDATKRSLASRAMVCAHEFADRFRSLTGFDLTLYGRGLQRDLGMTLARGYRPEELRMGCVSASNPAYTATMPLMDQYGWPLEMISLWQAGGDGTSYLPGFPHRVPGFGAVDMSVHIDGTKKTTLAGFRKACVL